MYVKVCKNKKKSPKTHTETSRNSRFFLHRNKVTVNNIIHSQWFPPRTLEPNLSALHGVKTHRSQCGEGRQTLSCSDQRCGINPLSHFSFRSKSLALHAVHSRSINPDTGGDGDGVELSPDNISPNTLTNQQTGNQEAPPTDGKCTAEGSVPAPPAVERGVGVAGTGEGREEDGEMEEQGEADRLFVHLRDNMETIRAFCRDVVRQIPTPEQCVIEGNDHSSVALVQTFT